MSHVTYEWVMSHMNKSCRVYMSHVTHEWDMSHWISHAIYEWVTSRVHNSCHRWICYVTYACVKSQMNESCHKRQCYWLVTIGTIVWFGSKLYKLSRALFQRMWDGGSEGCRIRQLQKNCQMVTLIGRKRGHYRAPAGWWQSAASPPRVRKLYKGSVCKRQSGRARETEWERKRDGAKESTRKGKTKK